jgi:hypothetical protein
MLEFERDLLDVDLTFHPTLTTLFCLISMRRLTKLSLYLDGNDCSSDDLIGNQQVLWLYVPMRKLGYCQQVGGDAYAVNASFLTTFSRAGRYLAVASYR